MRISDWSSDVCSSDLSSFFTGALAGSRLAATDSTTHAATTARRKRVRAVSSGIEPTPSASPSAGETINAAANRTGGERSEGRRGGKECVRKCREQRLPSHKAKNELDEQKNENK